MATIALLGYGRMGKMIEDIAAARGHEIVFRLSSHDNADFTLPDNTDVAIDFSSPNIAQQLCHRALSQGIPVVSGTTGWDVSTIAQEIELAQQTGFLHATNMSIGVNVMFAVNKVLAKALATHAYSAAITEVHHTHKLDAPSGTAITLAAGTVEAMPNYETFALKDDAAFAKTCLPITSIREGEVIGKHKVEYSNDIDTITLSHIASNRRGFALGALLAAEFMINKRGLYTMADVLGLDKLHSLT